MKRLALLASLLLTAALHAQQISKVSFTWTYNYSAIPVCTTSVTSNCIHHFDLTEGTTPIASIPATPATTYLYTMTPLPTAGVTHVYSLVAIEVLTGTATIASSPTNVSVLLPSPPATPSNFTATPQ